MRRWYVVHSHVQGEAKAAFNLVRQGFSVYLPQYLKLRRHARRRDWIKAPLFPRYLFVSLDFGRDRWRSVYSTIGVSHLICNGEHPSPIEDDVIGDIQAREDDLGMVDVSTYASYEKGEQVQILSGAFYDQVGIFECASGEERVRVLLSLLGRPIKVNLPLNAIGAVT